MSPYNKDKLMMSKQQIIAATDVAVALSDLLQNISYDRLFVLTDEHTSRLCYPLVADALVGAHLITIAAGDETNDLPMLEGADYAFCPCDSSIAEQFPNVCSCDDGAVADVIYNQIPEILKG